MPALWARALAHTVREAPERLAHPFRRRRALDNLAGREPPRAFLFLCHGNICRSPYAARAFARRLPASLAAHLAVRSAGFAGPGRPAPPEAVRSAARRGVDLSDHRSALLTATVAQEGELVLVMNELQRRAVCHLRGYDPGDVIVLGDLDPEPKQRREITDPWGQGEPTFECVYRRIDRCLDALIRTVPLDGSRAE